MKDRKTFVIPLTDKQIKNILICLVLARADMEQYKMIYEDMIDNAKKFEKVISRVFRRRIDDEGYAVPAYGWKNR